MSSTDQRARTSGPTASVVSTEQVTSPGAVDSDFNGWLDIRRGKGQFRDYDPDAAFAALERRLAGGESFPPRLV